MALRQRASDGKVFGVYNQGNGDYVAAEDDRGFHYAPSQNAVLPRWSVETARRKLREAVENYEASLREHDDYR